MTHQLTTTPHILERDGCTLHYWLAGPEERPLVVLTHGATMDHRMFVAQAEALTSHYRVLYWDVRGHGLSQPLNEDFSLRQAVADLLALLDRIGYERAALVGHSPQEIAAITETTHEADSDVTPKPPVRC